MLGYYTTLAIRSLRSHTALTVLMIAAVGVGIGASMTTLTIYRGMAADPIPEKSSQLFVPQIDSFGPQSPGSGPASEDGLQDRLSYLDAIGLLKAHAGYRQAALYRTHQVVMPADSRVRPFDVGVRATSADFFAMFAVPFLYGGGWSAHDDDEHAHVVVISRAFNDRLFAGANSVGRDLTLEGHKYRVLGVMDNWQPLPRFYDLDDAFSMPEDVFLPFSVAIEHRMEFGMLNCNKGAAGWDDMLSDHCVWMHFWVELPTAAAVAQYRRFLTNYASEQKRSGRFGWLARTQLRDVRDWLSYHKLVSTEVTIMVVVAFSFLFVCLLNAAGLMLAKLIGRAPELSVRRALGASRRAIFAQCLLEAALVGTAGGLLGLGLTDLGLDGLRSRVSQQGRLLMHLNASDVLIAVVLALLATLIAGVYPTWRAARLQPARHLKAL
jgi:putative ABC transport system permease protein